MRLIHLSVIILISNFLLTHCSQNTQAEVQCALILTSLNLKDRLQQVLCQHCNKFFSNKPSLKKHLRRINNPKQFACPNRCGKIFSRKHNARRHAQTKSCSKNTSKIYRPPNTERQALSQICPNTQLALGSVATPHLRTSNESPTTYPFFRRPYTSTYTYRDSPQKQSHNSSICRNIPLTLDTPLPTPRTILGTLLCMNTAAQTNISLEEKRQITQEIIRKERDEHKAIQEEMRRLAIQPL